MTVTPTDRLDGFDVALWWLLTLAGIGMVVKYFNLHIRIGNTPSGKFGVWIDGSGCAFSAPPPVRVGTSTLYRIPIAACRATRAGPAAANPASRGMERCPSRLQSTSKTRTALNIPTRWA